MDDADFYGKLVIGSILIFMVGLWLVDWSWQKFLIGFASTFTLGIVLTLGVGLPLIEGDKLGDVYDILILHFTFTLIALVIWEKMFEKTLMDRAKMYERMGWLESPGWKKGDD